MSASFVLALSLLSPGVAPMGRAAWEVEVGLTGAQLQRRTATLADHGFRPVQINAYNSQENLYTAIWAKLKDGEWKMEYGQTRRQFQTRNKGLSDKGWRLTSLGGCDLMGEERLMGVWVNRKGPEWEWFVGLDRDTLSTTLDALRKRKYRPTQLSTYEAGGANAYTLLAEKGDEVEWRIRWGLTQREFQGAVDDMSTRNWRLVSLGAHSTGSTLYTGLWEKRKGPEWRTRFGETQGEFVRTVQRMAAGGFRPICISGFPTLQGDRFTSIWEKQP